MTDMDDWARAVATKLEVGIEGQGPEQFIAAMSAALRKVARQNKADGIREAARILNTTPGLVVHSRTASIFNILEAAASKLNSTD